MCAGYTILVKLNEKVGDNYMPKKIIIVLLLAIAAHTISFQNTQGITLQEQLTSLSSKLELLKHKLATLESRVNNLKKNLSSPIYLSLVHGDMTKQKFADFKTAAIVNAANTAMRGGGGIDRAIHSAAGSGLLAYESENNLKNVVGGAILTPSFNLETNKVCAYIIHAVGPRGENIHRENLLTNAYQNSLQAAHDNHLTAIAFPAISTAIFGYDINEATPVALKAVLKFLDNNKETTSLKEVRFVVFSVLDYQVYVQKLQDEGYTLAAAEPAHEYHQDSSKGGGGTPQPPRYWRVK